MRQNIILVDQEPFTRRRSELFYIDKFIASGFNVQVWSLSSYLKMPGSYPNTIEADYVYNISSKEFFLSLLDKCKVEETIFILELGYSIRSFQIFKYLNKYNCLKVRISLYDNIIFGTRPGNKIIRIIKDGRIIDLLKIYTKSILLNGYKRLFPFKEYDYLFSSSKLTSRNFAINHPDYELWKYSLSAPELSGDYLVFCDIFFPEHPDLLAIHPSINAIKYRKTLSAFFSYVEKKTGKPVIIAAHPKAIYDSNDWGGRRVIKYQTNSLVKYSSGVLLHSSNSITFTILSDKPCILLTTDDMLCFNVLKMVFEGYHQAFDLPIYNLDHTQFEEIDFKRVDAELRQRYINTYLTSSEISGRRNFDIIKQAFCQL